MSTFIYAPRSGSRIFAANPIRGVVLATYSNESSHVFGGARLAVYTAKPRKYWRPAAHDAATAIVAAVGGVAFDDQGTVSIVVPKVSLARAAAIMVSVAGDNLDPHESDELLLAAGCAINDDLRPIRPMSAVRHPLTRISEVSTYPITEDRGGLRIVVELLDGGEPVVHEQSIPIGWLPLTLQHGYQQEQIVSMQAEAAEAERFRSPDRVYTPADL